MPEASAWRARSPGAGRGPPEAATSRSAPAISASAGVSRGPTTRTRSRSRWRDPDLGRVGRPDGRLPVAGWVEAPDRAQEQPQRSPLLVEAEGDPRSGLAARVASAPATRVDGLVVGARARPARSRRGRSARSAARSSRELVVRASRRPRKISTSGRATWVERMRSVGLVEAADVERARVAQRGRGDAGRERVVDVDEVEVDPAEQPSSARRRRAATARRAVAGRAAAGSRCRAPRTARRGGRRTATPERVAMASGDRLARVADLGGASPRAPRSRPGGRGRRARPRCGRRTR